MQPGLAGLLFLPDPPLPARPAKSDRYGFESLDPQPGSLAHALLTSMRETADAAASALEVIALELTNEHASLLARWQSNRQLNQTLDDISALPPEAFVVGPRLKGFIPAARSASAARVYVALLVTLAFRMLFLGEQRGLDAIASSVEGRLRTYGTLLTQESYAVAAGFPALRSLLQAAVVSDKAHALANHVAASFPSETRAFVAVCVTYELLASCGRRAGAGTSGSQEASAA